MEGVFPMHDVPGKGSNAALIQDAVPEARVVKAFNTLGFWAWVDPDATGGPVSILIAGDDAEAKAFVVDLTEGMGLHAVDVGPLAYAHILEELIILWGYARDRDMSFNYYLRPDPVSIPRRQN